VHTRMLARAQQSTAASFENSFQETVTTNLFSLGMDPFGVSNRGPMKEESGVYAFLSDSASSGSDWEEPLWMREEPMWQCRHCRRLHPDEYQGCPISMRPRRVAEDSPVCWGAMSDPSDMFSESGSTPQSESSSFALSQPRSCGSGNTLARAFVPSGASHKTLFSSRSMVPTTVFSSRSSTPRTPRTAAKPSPAAPIRCLAKDAALMTHAAPLQPTLDHASSLSKSREEAAPEWRDGPITCSALFQVDTDMEARLQPKQEPTRAKQGANQSNASVQRTLVLEFEEEQMLEGEQRIGTATADSNAAARPRPPTTKTQDVSAKSKKSEVFALRGVPESHPVFLLPRTTRPTPRSRPAITTRPQAPPQRMKGEHENQRAAPAVACASEAISIMQAAQAPRQLPSNTTSLSIASVDQTVHTVTAQAAPPWCFVSTLHFDTESLSSASEDQRAEAARDTSKLPLEEAPTQPLAGRAAKNARLERWNRPGRWWKFWGTG